MRAHKIESTLSLLSKIKYGRRTCGLYVTVDNYDMHLLVKDYIFEYFDRYL